MKKVESNVGTTGESSGGFGTRETGAEGRTDCFVPIARRAGRFAPLASTAQSPLKGRGHFSAGIDWYAAHSYHGGIDCQPVGNITTGCTDTDRFDLFRLVSFANRNSSTDALTDAGRQRNADTGAANLYP